jgi:hypothetical protein
MMNATTPRPQWVDVTGPLLAVTSVVAFVGCVTLAIILGVTGIRPREITGTHILLSGVCEAFADAVENAEIEHRVRLRQWEIQDVQDESRGVRTDHLSACMHKPATVDAIERAEPGRVVPTDTIQE